VSLARAREPAVDDPADESEQQEGVLADLIEVEQRVLEATRAAEAEAERVIAEVQAELDARTSEGDVALDEAVCELRAQLDVRRAEALAEIEHDSAAAARRYREVDDARVDTLATFVAQRVARGDLERDDLEADTPVDSASRPGPPSEPAS